MKQKLLQRFAIGTKVWITTLGLDGVVTQIDDTPSLMGGFWHTIRTKHGERQEPGYALERIPEPVGQEPKRSPLTQNIHIHGPNARINTNSADNSVNVATVSNDQIFLKIRDAVGAVDNESDRAEILARLDQLQQAQGSTGFLNAYQQFIASVADYITIFTPFIPALTAMLSGK